MKSVPSKNELQIIKKQNLSCCPKVHPARIYLNDNVISGFNSQGYGLVFAYYLLGAKSWHTLTNNEL